MVAEVNEWVATRVNYTSIDCESVFAMIFASTNAHSALSYLSLLTFVCVPMRPIVTHGHKSRRPDGRTEREKNNQQQQQH